MIGLRRLFLVILAVSGSALLCLRYFPGGLGSPEPAPIGTAQGAPADAAALSASPHRATALPASGPLPYGENPKTSGGLWSGFLRWAGLSAKPGTDARGESQKETQSTNVAKRGSLKDAGGGEPHDPLLSSISGKVLDEAGQPVPWMGITAEPVGLFQAQEGAPARGPVAQASSNTEGAFRFEQLPEGEYRLRTIATDLYEPAEVVTRTGVDSADLVVSGERELTIEGQVRDNQGKPLERVRVAHAPTPSAEATTDQNGSYRLQISVNRSNRDYIVKFQLAGYREEAHQLSESQINGQSPIRLDARLTPIRSMAAVGGRVRNREGLPLSGESVSLIGPGRYEAVTNQAGEFVMADVEAGQSYNLRIAARSPYRPYVKQIQVGPEGLWQDVMVERGAPESGPLSGRMMDLTGNPLPRFTLWLQSFNPAAPGLVQVTSDDTGRYEISEVPLGLLSFITKSQPRFLIRGITLPEGGAENVDLILDWAGYEVRGQVVDLQGRPVAGAKVLLFWSLQNNGVLSQSERETASDAEGFFRFAQVGPGLHSVRVSVPGVGNALMERNVGADFSAVVVQLNGEAQTAFIRN